MFCSSCGAQNQDGAARCHACGVALAYPAQVAQAGPSAYAPEVPNYLVQSILVTICCCMPLGIVAIVFAAQVQAKLDGGDVAGAMRASSNARTFCWVAFGLGLLSCVPGAIYFLVMTLGVAGGMGGL